MFKKAIKSNMLETYQLLHVAQQDISQSAFFADHLLKQGWHSEPWETSWQNYLHQGAYMTAMVVAYSRPFTESRGFPKFPGKLLRQLGSEEKELHHQLLNLRNEVYAHTDVTSRKVRPILLDGKPTAIEVLPPMRMSDSELVAIRLLIGKVSQAIHEKLQLLAESVVERFE